MMMMRLDHITLVIGKLSGNRIKSNVVVSLSMEMHSSIHNVFSACLVTDRSFYAIRRHCCSSLLKLSRNVMDGDWNTKLVFFHTDGQK